MELDLEAKVNFPDKKCVWGARGGGGEKEGEHCTSEWTAWMGNSYSFIWPECGLRRVGPGTAGEAIVKCLPANPRRAPSVGPTARQVRGSACPGTAGFPGSDHIMSIDQPGPSRMPASVSTPWFQAPGTVR